MAQGSIRIIRDAVSTTGGETNGGTSSTPTQGNPARVSATIEREPDAPTVTVRSSPTTRRKHSETKRSSLSVEDRDGDSSSQVTSSQPNKKTPAPPKAEEKTRVYNRRSRAIHYSESEAQQSAQWLLSAVEMVGVMTAGPRGEMTEFERGMITPALRRVLQRTPIGIIERANPIIDLAFVVMGGALYFNRISGSIRFPTRAQTRGVQEDTKAPHAAPVERTVDNVKPGDVDGIAPPVPTAISQHMNNGAL